MTPQELKNSILQLAIQGRLVEQRPEEGTAEELYRQIQREKATLVKAGKIKKEKPLPEITEEEVPFEIPEGWKWVRLNSITFNHGQTVPVEEFSYIDIGSIDNKNQRLSTEENIIAAEKAPSRARRIVVHGDILYSTVRPYLHNMCIVDREFSRQPIASTGFAVMSCPVGIHNRYLFYYLMSPAFDSYANNTENAKGVAYPAINDDRLYRAVIALPPLSEQRRIVAKIEELLPYIDRYEKAWSRLEDFNKRFPTDMQKSILQLAIQGKLVPQRPEEGTGEALYQQIQAEKQSLIRSGKLKKEKPLPEITPDEIPFDIPESWMWVHMGELFNIHSSRRIHANEYTSKGVPFFRSLEVVSLAKGIEPSVSFYISEERYSEIAQDYIMPKHGDLLITCIGGSIGWNWIVDDRKFYYKDGNVVAFDGHNNMCTDYLQKYLSSPLFQQQVSNDVSGTAYNALTIEMLKSYIIPLPPLAEQKRIVAKLEELLPLCERLK